MLHHESPDQKGLGTRGGGTGLEQHGHAEGGATNTPVGCLLVRGSQRVGMSTGMTAVLWWSILHSTRTQHFLTGDRFGIICEVEIEYDPVIKDVD